MNSYFIMSPGWTHTSSGVRTLHLLCHALNEMGQKASMVPANAGHFSLNNDLKTPLWNGNTSPDDVVVYPEIINGNPLGAKKVVRYILGQKDNLNFGSNDMLWSCTTALGKKFGTDKIITVPTFDRKLFHNQNRERSGSCFYSNKYDRLWGNKLLPITDGMTRIQGSAEHVAEIYHTHEKCYVYEDTEAMFNASLCGCRVILIRTPYFDNVGTMTEENEFYQYSGLEWDNGEKINEGMGTVDECLDRLEKQLPIQLAKFVAETQG